MIIYTDHDGHAASDRQIEGIAKALRIARMMADHIAPPVSLPAIGYTRHAALVEDGTINGAWK